MGFSIIKTNWIGMGSSAWEGVEIMGNVLELITELRVLSFRFNVFNNFSAHVLYWLERGLGVRSRISALGMRFGEDALDAWRTYRLIQAVYLPTMYYGHEFLADHQSYVRRIEVQVNDTLRSLFWMPIHLANNILLAESDIPPVHITGRYMQRRCHSRIINY